jgi:hypothetical protein
MDISIYPNQDPSSQYTITTSVLEPVIVCGHCLTQETWQFCLNPLLLETNGDLLNIGATLFILGNFLNEYEISTK